MQLGSWSPDLHVICLLFSCHSRDHSATITDVIGGSLSGTAPTHQTTPPEGRVVKFISPQRLRANPAIIRRG